MSGLEILLPVLVMVVAAAGHLGLVVRARRSGRRWSRWRSAAWFLGCLLALLAVTGPLATAAEQSATAHMAAHLMLGMLAPLLLVSSTPVTLLLRALPTRSARRLSRLLRGRLVRTLTEPLVAGTLDVGGLWLLYATPLLSLAHEHPVVHVSVHAHVLLAGYLFTAVLVGRDPLPHRRSTSYRLVVLALAMAAHDVLAKRLFAAPPVALGTDVATGAQLMYYGGDAVDLLLAVLVCARESRRRRLAPARELLRA